MLVLISGVSGAGKDTIKKAIIERRDKTITVPSFTSRPMREGEVQGVSYHFVSKEEFEKRIEDGEFFEYNVYNDNYYGTSKKLISDKINEGYTVICDIDVNGAENFIRISKESGLELKTIFLKVPKDLLVERIKGRNPEMPEEELNNRIGRMDYEESKIPMFDYVVENIDLEKAINEVMEIIEK